MRGLLNQKVQLVSSTRKSDRMRYVARIFPYTKKHKKRKDSMETAETTGCNLYVPIDKMRKQETVDVIPIPIYNVPQVIHIDTVVLVHSLTCERETKLTCSEFFATVTIVRTFWSAYLCADLICTLKIHMLYKHKYINSVKIRVFSAQLIPVRLLKF